MKQLRFLMLALVLAAFVPSMAQSRQVMIETTEGNILVTLYDDTPRHRLVCCHLARTGCTHL